MKSCNKRILASILAALMLLPATACSTATDDPSNATPDAATESETLSQDELLYGDLPEGNYEDYEFNVLQYKEIALATSTVLTERTGNPIEDSIYERALAVEERLGVKFVNNLDTLDGAVTRLRNCIAGGLDEYDVFWNHSGATISNFLIAGYLYDLNNIEALDFTKPWWDDTAIENLRLDDHLYMAFGDINIYLFDFHSVLLFNKDVSDKHHLNLYQMVKNGEWTIEEFVKLGVDLAEPSATGAGYDRMAYVGYAAATMYGFLHGADVKIISRDEDNVPVMGPLEESIVDVLSAYNTLFKDSALCDTGDGDAQATFAAQKATFASVGVGALSALRKESFNYGILPFPKRDVAQKDYISFVSNQIQPMVIPKSASNTERTGIILENLAAESYRRVRPEYFEILLYSKYVRDPESLENIQMIFNNETRFELEHVYDWGNFADQLLKHLINQADSFASSHKSHQKVINKAINSTLAQLAKHKN